MRSFHSSATLLAVSYDFGEIPFTFESDDEAWLALLERRYRAFRAIRAHTGPSVFTVRFESTRAPAPAELVTPLATHLEALETRKTPGGFRVSSETTSCDVDLLSRKAELRGPSAMYPLDNLLRHLLPLIWNEGVLVHGAFLTRSSGGGLLAGGPSGAGKSTLCRLASDHALCDELTAVRVESEGSHLISLPFWESRPGRAPLDAMIFLSHGAPHRLAPLSPERALRRLVPLVLWPVWDEGAMASAFAHVARLSESRPAFELAFAPRPDVWEFIDKEVPRP
jgi:hypothetical protein